MEVRQDRQQSILPPFGLLGYQVQASLHWSISQASVPLQSCGLANTIIKARIIDIIGSFHIPLPWSRFNHQLRCMGFQIPKPALDLDPSSI